MGHRPAVWSRAPYSSKRLGWQPVTSLVANLDTLSSQKVPVCKTLAQSKRGFTGFRAMGSPGRAASPRKGKPQELRPRQRATARRERAEPALLPCPSPTGRRRFLFSLTQGLADSPSHPGARVSSRVRLVSAASRFLTAREAGRYVLLCSIRRDWRPCMATLRF